MSRQEINPLVGGLFAELRSLSPELATHSEVNHLVYKALVDWYSGRADLTGGQKKWLLQWGEAALLHDVGKMGILPRLADSWQIVHSPDECCGFSESELFEVRRQHPLIGGYGLLVAEKVKGRTDEVNGLEKLAWLVFGHHEKLDGLPVASFPRQESRLQDPWKLLVMLFFQLADSVSANTLPRSYRPINPETGKRNLSLEETERWVKILLSGDVLRKIFPGETKEKLGKFRQELFGKVMELTERISKMPVEIDEFDWSGDGVGLLLGMLSLGREMAMEKGRYIF